MKCENCGDRIKACGCGLGHGYVHVELDRAEQIHRCWPNPHVTGLVPGRGHIGGRSPMQGRQDTFAKPV